MNRAAYVVTEVSNQCGTSFRFALYVTGSFSTCITSHRFTQSIRRLYEIICEKLSHETSVRESVREHSLIYRRYGFHKSFQYSCHPHPIVIDKEAPVVLCPFIE